MFAETAFLFFDAIGTMAFAISGAMVACKKNTDLFGVIFLAEITALGGGMTRDVLLGRTPPSLFTNWSGLSISLIMALIVFFAVRYQRELYQRNEALVESINNVIDAIGLGMFAVTGAQTAIYTGHGSNPFLVICMGTLTAVVGGLLRDIILSDIPFILTKYVYAVAAICGAAVYYFLDRYHFDETLAMSAGICVTFVLRCLATKYRWNLPKPMK